MAASSRARASCAARSFSAIALFGFFPSSCRQEGGRAAGHARRTAFSPRTRLLRPRLLVPLLRLGLGLLLLRLRERLPVAALAPLLALALALAPAAALAAALRAAALRAAVAAALAAAVAALATAPVGLALLLLLLLLCVGGAVVASQRRVLRRETIEHGHLVVLVVARVRLLLPLLLLLVLLPLLPPSRAERPHTAAAAAVLLAVRGLVRAAHPRARAASVGGTALGVRRGPLRRDRRLDGVFVARVLRRQRLTAPPPLFTTHRAAVARRALQLGHPRKCLGSV